MRYIITSIQEGAPLHRNFFSNILKFKEVHKVDKILVFVMNGRVKEEVVHPSIAERPDIEFISTNTKLNNKVLVYDTKTLAQNIDPLSGQGNKLPSEYSYIMPGTKRRYIQMPSIGTRPRFFCSTGSMTLPNYNVEAKSSGMLVKRGRQALAQHEYGFVYFQDSGAGKFEVYPLDARKNGSFIYLNESYDNGVMKKGKFIEALVLGDWHTYDTNPEVRLKTIEMIQTLEPKRVVFHDLFNGHSVNHHEKGKLIQTLRYQSTTRQSLEQELRMVLTEIEFFANKFPRVQFVVAESNHDLFIKSYIDDRLFYGEDHNFIQVAKIATRILDHRKVVLEEALLTVTNKLPSNFVFLRENDPFRIGGNIEGVAVGQHGHKGINGARGSANSFRKTNAKMISAHTHTPMIYENGMVVGTSTYLELPYTVGGLSSWLNAHGILYTNKTFSLLTIIPKKTKRN